VAKSDLQNERYTKQEIGTAWAFGVAIFLLLWMRRPDCLLNAQFWAEDGGLFFRDQMLYGFAKALVRPYAGYIHVIPRLIAGVAAWLPVRWVPLAYNTCALLIDAISCGAFFWPCFRRIIRSDPLRAACCVAMTAAIMPGSELIATLANVQWYLSILSLLLLVAGGSDSTKTTEAVRTIAQIFILFTAPATLLFLPILLWQLKTRPGLLKVSPALHVSAFCLQIWIMWRFAERSVKPVLHFNSLFLATTTSYLSRCVLVPMFGAHYLIPGSEIAMFTKMVVALIGGVALGTVLILRLRGSIRLSRLLGGWYVGLGSLVMVLSGRGFAKDFLTLQGIEHFTAERYFFIGSCMFIASAGLAIDSFTERQKPAIGAALLLGVFALGIIHNYVVPPFWDFNWRKNADKIDKWNMARKRHERVAAISFPINPDSWVVYLDGDK